MIDTMKRNETLVYCAPQDGSFCRPDCEMIAARQFICLTSAQQALALGYLPCEHCYPAPPECMLGETRNVDGFRAGEFFSDMNFYVSSEQRVADALDVSLESLKDSVMHRYGLGLEEFFGAQKLLNFIYLMQGSNLSLERAARVSGYDSLEDLEENSRAFRFGKGRLVDAYRKQDKLGGRRDAILFLPYHPPYPWERMLRFFGRRAIAGVETIENSVYRRTVALRRRNTTYTGWIELRHAPERNCLKLTVSRTLIPVLPSIVWRVGHIFDLSLVPGIIAQPLSSLFEAVPNIQPGDIRLPGIFDGFEMGVRTVLGRESSMQEAARLAGCFVREYGHPIETPHEGLDYVFPTSEDCTAHMDRHKTHSDLGITPDCMASIRAFAEAMVEGRLRLKPYANPIEEMEILARLPGFGEWSTQYLALRTLKYTDAFPLNEGGVMNASAPEMIRSISEEWRPFRAYATLLLWENPKILSN